MSSMRGPVQFSEKIYMYTFEPVLVTGSRSGENLRLVCSWVVTFKSVTHSENRVENRGSI
jgi:hypothetical protein